MSTSTTYGEPADPRRLGCGVATIGVVIPTLNAGAGFEYILRAVLKSSLKPKVLVVDSSSNDGTPERALALGAEVHSVRRETFNHGSTREAARKALGCSVVVMLTQDAEPVGEEWLESLVAPIVSGRAVAAYARQIPRTGSNVLESFPRNFNYPESSELRGFEHLPRLGSFTFFCSNSCAAYDNAALDVAGGFPHVLAAEDTLVVTRLLQHGGRVAYVANAVVRHSHNFTLSEEFRRHFDAGYVRSENPVQFRLGSDQSRGRLYAKLFLLAVFREHPPLVPYAAVVLAVKYFGYLTGRCGHWLPRSMRRALSANSAYWQQARAPASTSPSPGTQRAQRLELGPTGTAQQVRGGMRIAMLVETAATGVGRHVIELSRGLLQGDHEVHVLYSPRCPDQQFVEGLAGLAKYPAFRAHKVMMRHGIHLTDAVAIAEVFSHVRGIRPDVVHCHSTKAGFLGRVALWPSRVPVVYTPHALYSQSPHLGAATRRLVGWLEAVLARRCGMVIAVSAEEARHAASLGIPPQKVTCIHNGVPSPEEPLEESLRNRARRQLGANGNEIVIGFVGRLVSQKAVDNLLRAYALAEPSFTAKTQLAIVGDGPQQASLMTLARTLGLNSEAVRWHGYHPGPLVIRGFDVLVLPSDYEGFSYVPLEACAAGVPIVITDVGGARAVVDHGRNGLVVPRRHPAELAAAMATLVNSEETRYAMGAASRVTIAKFSVDEMVRHTAGVYSEVLRGQRECRSGVVTVSEGS